MSLADDVVAAGKEELSKPEFRAAIESFERVLLQVAGSAFLSMLPGVVRIILGGVLQSFINKGIDAAVKLTDIELASLHAEALGVVTQHLQAMGVVEFQTPDSDKIHTKADLERLHPEVMK